MLTIENIAKVYKYNVCGWQIGIVETTNSAYLFQLRKPTGESMQVNLERNIINGDNKYELWHWKTSPAGGYGTPNRLMFKKEAFETPNRFLNAMNLLLM